MKYSHLIIIIIQLISSVLSAQTNTISVKFDTVTYDAVTLKIYQQKGTQSFRGVKDSTGGWVFSYPSKLYEQLHSMDMTGMSGNTRRDIRLCSNKEENCNDRRLDLFSVSSKNFTEITLQHFSSVAFPSYNSIRDCYCVTHPQEDQQLAASMHSIETGFEYFKYTPSDSAYLNQIQLFTELILEYPDSYRFMSLILGAKSRFQSKKDVENLFNHFTKEVQESFYGRQVKEFIDTYPSFTVFTNRELPNCTTGNNEPILCDTTRFNLIVFSASWCKPCHNLIPYLKEASRRYQDSLVITYVSIDASSTVEKWKQFIESEKNVWRSLLAEKDLETVKKQYFAYSIPRLLLVFPGGRKMKKIEHWPFEKLTDNISQEITSHK